MAMQFWRVEVKPGTPITCNPGVGSYIHLSLACLGESKVKEKVALFVKVGDKKLQMGSLSSATCAQITYDLVFEKEFELSHSSENVSVTFCGYTTLLSPEESDEDDSESEEDEPIPLNTNVVPEPLPDSDDLSSDSYVEKTEFSSDSDEVDEEEETPKPATLKRPAESSSKTPVPEKKAKIVTPVGAKAGDEGKKSVRVATPHPAKKGGKTSANTPNSAASVSCKSCSKVFNSDNALQAHTKAKHA